MRMDDYAFLLKVSLRRLFGRYTFWKGRRLSLVGSFLDVAMSSRKVREELLELSESLRDGKISPDEWAGQVTSLLTDGADEAGSEVSEGFVGLFLHVMRTEAGAGRIPVPRRRKD